MEGTISQRDVERVLGRLITDQGFRNEFFLTPDRAILRIGAVVTGDEIQALLRVPRAAPADLCSRLDDRICRLYVDSSPAQEPSDAIAPVAEGQAPGAPRGAPARTARDGGRGKR